ncbi:MAG: LysR family transcriptional regulator [Pseudomonadota bacterium]
MQDINWNDLRHVLALARSGTMIGAARLQGVDETTVARRIRTIEAALEGALFRRAGQVYAPTSLGEAVLVHASAVEASLEALQTDIGAARAVLTGHVRLTAVPLLINRLIVPRLSGFLSVHPDIRVEAIADSRNVDLRAHEADLCLRFARPEAGGLDVVMRKAGSLPYGVFARVRNTSGPWIRYGAAQTHLPPMRWIMAQDGARSGLLVQDAETALEAAAAGIGKCVLPRIVGERDERLQRIDEDLRPPDRELWLMWRKGASPAVDVLRDWLAGLLRDQASEG